MTPKDLELYLAASNLTRYLLNEAEPVNQIIMSALVAKGLQEKIYIRDRKSTRYKIKNVLLPPEAAFQHLIFHHTEDWEIRQEKGDSSTSYIPTEDDYFRRYIKFLIYKSFHKTFGKSRLTTFLATGFGCLLYDYTPGDLADFTFSGWNDSLMRSYNIEYRELIKIRFPDLDWITPSQKNLPVRPARRFARHSDREILREALTSFTIWGTEHLSQQKEIQDLIEEILDDEKVFAKKETQNKREIYRLHILTCDFCGGFEIFVKTFLQENIVRKNPNSLTEVEKKLMVPIFKSEADDGSVKNPDSLTESEESLNTGENSDSKQAVSAVYSTPTRQDFDEMIAVIEELNNRVENFSGDVLRLEVDRDNYDYFFFEKIQEITIPKNSEYIKIYGSDEQGELLLASFPVYSFTSEELNTNELIFKVNQRIEISLLVDTESSDSEIAVKINTATPSRNITFNGILEQIYNLAINKERLEASLTLRTAESQTRKFSIETNRSLTATLSTAKGMAIGSYSVKQGENLEDIFLKDNYQIELLKPSHKYRYLTILIENNSADIFFFAKSDRRNKGILYSTLVLDMQFQLKIPVVLTKDIKSIYFIWMEKDISQTIRSIDSNSINEPQNKIHRMEILEKLYSSIESENLEYLISFYQPFT